MGSSGTRRPQLLYQGVLKTCIGLKMSAADIMFYTGVSKTVFPNLVEAICKMTTGNSRLPAEDQLLIKLMRLRLGFLYGDLARRFETSVTRIGDIVRNMLGILKKIMNYIVVWLPKSHIKSSMPASFVEGGYSKMTCIFDCTEILLRRPRKLIARAQTFSSYKANNTVKFFTVIAPMASSCICEMCMVGGLLINILCGTAQSRTTSSVATKLWPIMGSLWTPTWNCKG